MATSHVKCWDNMIWRSNIWLNCSFYHCLLHIYVCMHVVSVCVSMYVYSTVFNQFSPKNYSWYSFFNSCDMFSCHFLICSSIMICAGWPRFSWYHTTGYKGCFQHYPRCEFSCKRSITSSYSYILCCHVGYIWNKCSTAYCFSLQIMLWSTKNVLRMSLYLLSTLSLAFFCIMDVSRLFLIIYYCHLLDITNV